MRRRGKQRQREMGNGEKAGESRQMLLSRQEASLMRGKQFICVEEKRYSEPESRWGPVEIWETHHNAPDSLESRHGTAKMKPQCTAEMHREGGQAENSNTHLRLDQCLSSDNIKTFLLNHEEKHLTSQKWCALWISNNLTKCWDFNKEDGKLTAHLDRTKRNLQQTNRGPFF